MQLTNSDICTGSAAPGACSLETDAATTLATKNTSDIAAMTSISILNLLLVALTETFTLALLLIFSMGLYCSHA